MSSIKKTDEHLLLVGLVTLHRSVRPLTGKLTL